MNRAGVVCDPRNLCGALWHVPAAAPNGRPARGAGCVPTGSLMGHGMIPAEIAVVDHVFAGAARGEGGAP